MALADTNKAIGAVTRLLRDRLLAAGFVTNVSIGKPEPPSNPANPRVNLFLYEVTFDGSLKNTPLDEGAPPPLWLVLKYLLTAFDTGGDSDTIEAHELLGEGAQVLQDLNFLGLNGLTADTVKALRDNPDLLKLTFEDASHELLSKIMQGTDEKYRCSLAFQVRPVMIASSQPPAYSLLVGVNYVTNTIIGDAGVQIPVLPSMGPTVTSVEPDSFEVGDTLKILGEDLSSGNLSVSLGPVTIPPTAQTPGWLTCVVPAALGSGTTISAGPQTLAVVQQLPTGRLRSSNFITGKLAPVVASVALSGLTRIGAPGSNVFGLVDVTGNLLGLPADDVYLAFYQNGRVVLMTDDIVAMPPPPQTGVRFRVTSARAIPPGVYTLILRVNGAQARNSPQVNWVA